MPAQLSPCFKERILTLWNRGKKRPLNCLEFASGRANYYSYYTLSLEATLTNQIGDRCRGPIRHFNPNPGELISEWGLQIKARQFVCADRAGKK